MLFHRQGAMTRTLGMLQPIARGVLLTTLALPFGFQGEQILAQLLVVPVLIQVYVIAGLRRRFGVARCVAAPIGLFGVGSAPRWPPWWVGGPKSR